MLSRFKCLLSILVLFSGFSAIANANESPDVLLDTSKNSVAIVGCLLLEVNNDPLDLEMFVISVDPVDFAYVEQEEPCAVALARAKHYGWDIALTNEIIFFDEAESVIFTLIKN